MIPRRVHNRASEAAWPADLESVGRPFDEGSHALEPFDDGGDPIAFLHSKLCGIPNDGYPLGGRSEERDERKLVHRHDDEIPPDLERPAVARPHPDGAEGLAALLSDVGHFDERAERPQDLEQARPRRIDANPLDHDLRVRQERGRDQQKRRGRDVAGDGHRSVLDICRLNAESISRRSDRDT